MPDAFDEIREAENSKLKILEEKHLQQWISPIFYPFVRH